MTEKHRDIRELKHGVIVKEQHSLFEPRISRFLMNQYPDVYWQIVFTFFERDLKNGKFCKGVASVAAFLDCHEFVPKQYHWTEDEPTRHYYRTQERPRLGQLWNQFVAEGHNVARRVFVPPPHQTVHIPTELKQIWKDAPVVNGSIQLNYLALFNLLVGEIDHFEGGYLQAQRTGIVLKRPPSIAYRRGGQAGQREQQGQREHHRGGGNAKYVFTSLPVIQSQQAYYLTLYEGFRKEVNAVRGLAIAIAPDIQKRVNQEMDLIVNHPLRRNLVYRGLFRLLMGSDRFRDANLEHDGDGTRPSQRFVNYLKWIGVYNAAWVDLWPERVPQLDQWPNTGFRVNAVLPREDANIISFLNLIAIITPEPTNGELIEYLVDAMVEYAQDAPDQANSLSLGRMQGMDLQALDHFTGLPIPDDQAPPQAQPEAQIDPIRVRSQIIWLSVIQFPLVALYAYNEQYFQEDEHVYNEDDDDDPMGYPNWDA